MGAEDTGQSSAVLPPGYSFAEELAHSLIHGLGVVLSIVGLTVLVVFSALRGTAWHVVSCMVYGVTLILLYTASTLYHSIPRPRARRVLRVVDHCAIFLLIAGTYTPFTLVNLRGPWGWGLFAAVWTLAAAGIAFKLVATGKLRILSVVFYLALGWCVVVAMEPLARTVAPEGIALLALGGICYTVGVVFYAWKKLPYHHAIWHVFVLAGSILHYFAVLWYVIPGWDHAASG